MIRLVLVKSDRSPANCWMSLLEGEFECDPFVFDKMEKKMTLERFQREVRLLRVTEKLWPYFVRLLLQNPGFDFSGAEITGNTSGGGPQW